MFHLISLVTVFSCSVYASNIYSRMATDLPKPNILHIVKRPGDCLRHEKYPDTFQCAETGLCLPFSAFKNGVKDCCGPKQIATCTDLSDENRAAPNASCSSHIHYNVGMTFQCAITGQCLSRLTDTLNGRCDCCPTVTDGDCEKCNDHSDEECYFGDLQSKFYCDGKCMSMDLWENGVQDCPSSCIEPDVKPVCESKISRELIQTNAWFCAKYVEKKTPHCNCTSESKCLPPEAFMNGVSDCQGGEDESATNQPACTQAEAIAHCKTGYTKCFKVCNAAIFECRYPDTVA